MFQQRFTYQLKMVKSDNQKKQLIMKAKNIFLFMLAFIAMPMNAQNYLIVAKNDGAQLQFDLSKKPYLLFSDDKLEIQSNDKSETISYLDFNYFGYQGQQPSNMKTLVTTTNDTKLYEVENGAKVYLLNMPKLIKSNEWYEEKDEKGNSLYTKNSIIQQHELDASSPYYDKLPFNSFLDIAPAQSSAQPYVAFAIPPMGSGTYDLYLVTIPLSFAENVSEEDAAKGYQFRVNMFYRREDGNLPATRNETLKTPADAQSMNFQSNPTKVDTIFLGTKTFDADVTLNPSMLVQIQSYVATKETVTYSRRMCINGLILKAHDEDFSTAKFVQFNADTMFPTYELEQISCFDQLSFTPEIVSNDILSSQLRVKLDDTPFFADMDFYGVRLQPDANGIIRIPYILFPGYDYKYTPFCFVEGAPATIRVNGDTGSLFASEVSMDETDVYISTKVLGMKTFWEQNVKALQSSGRSMGYRLGVELTNTKTGRTAFNQILSDFSMPWGAKTTNLTDEMSSSVSLKIYELGFDQTFQCRAFLQYDEVGQMFDGITPEELRCYDSHVINFTTPTRTEYENKLKTQCLPQMMAKDASISLFNQALAATHVGDLLLQYIDESYHLSPDSANTWFPHHKASSVDIVGYMTNRYIGFTGFVEPDDVFAQHGITSLDDLRAYAKQIYDDMYPEDANVSDETDRRNSLNRFVSYHFLPERMNYSQLTVDNQMLNNFDRKHWDVAEWYETMMPYSIMKISYPSGAEAGRYVNRRGVQNRQDVRGVFERGAKIAPQEDNQSEQSACNGVYHYIDDIIDYGRNTQEVVLNERMRIDATALSPDFITSGARGHRVVGTGTVPKYPGQYTSESFSSDPSVNPNHCIGFKAGAAKNFMFNSQQTHLYLRNRYLDSWSYQGDEMVICGNVDVTFKLPPVPAGDYELRAQVSLGFESNGIVMYYIDGKPCGLPKDLRKNGEHPSIGWLSDATIGDSHAIMAYDRALHNRGWMKGPRSYGSKSPNSSGTPYYMRDTSSTLRHVITTFHSDGKTDHYLRIQQLEQSSNFPFDYIELCPRTIYDNDMLTEDKW